MNQPLAPGGGMDADNMSQASSQSRSRLDGSLLDRIRAQQSREQQQEGQIIVGPDPTPSQITIPVTNQRTAVQHQHPVHASADFSELGSSSMMTASGFGGFSMGGAGNVEGGPTEALLGEHSYRQGPNYSMSQYFQTFVMDIYSLFRSLPVWAQVILVAFMIFLVVKLI